MKLGDFGISRVLEGSIEARLGHEADWLSAAMCEHLARLPSL